MWATVNKAENNEETEYEAEPADEAKKAEVKDVIENIFLHRQKEK